MWPARSTASGSSSTATRRYAAPRHRASRRSPRETKQSILQLDAYVQAGKTFAEHFRNVEAAEAEERAIAAAANPGGGMLEAADLSRWTACRLSTGLRSGVLPAQARQLGIQQLPQIRIVQAGDETLIENLQATSALTVPAWKQKMVILLGLSRQKSALELQKTVTDATNEMIRQASEMMKDQAIAIEQRVAARHRRYRYARRRQSRPDRYDWRRSQGAGGGPQEAAEAEQQMEKMTVELKKAMIEAR